MTVTTTALNNTTQSTKPPCLTKTRLVNISFDEKDFPLLSNTMTPTSSTLSHTTTTASASNTPAAVVTAVTQ